jgi:acetyl-CoA carboxylase biotin carboxyl carrier protein
MGGKEIKSNVSGTIVSLTITRGGNVDEGDEICVVESMKMEIPIVAETSGVIAEVLVDTGHPVEEGQAIVVLEE